MTTPKIMPVNVLDMIEDVSTMTTLASGGYIRIKLSMWCQGGRLIGDEDLLRRITRMDRRQWKAERHLILERLTKHEADGGRSIWKQEALSKNFEKARLRSLQNAKNARGKRL
ncbi:MAG: hypothetical protein AAFN27_20550 [Pseudomonadota bacterium]